MAIGESINRKIDVVLRRIVKRLEVLEGTIASPQFKGKSLRNIGTTTKTDKRVFRKDEAFDFLDHVNADSNVHGIGAGSSVVGTNTIQVLTNKAILWNMRVVTDNYTITSTDTFIFVYGADITITLPDGSALIGQDFFIGNMNTNEETVKINTTGTDKINDEIEQVIYPSDTAKITYVDDTYTWRAT